MKTAASILRWKPGFSLFFTSRASHQAMDFLRRYCASCYQKDLSTNWAMRCVPHPPAGLWLWATVISQSQDPKILRSWISLVSQDLIHCLSPDDMFRSHIGCPPCPLVPLRIALRRPSEVASRRSYIQTWIYIQLLSPVKVPPRLEEMWPSPQGLSQMHPRTGWEQCSTRLTVFQWLPTYWVAICSRSFYCQMYVKVFLFKM